MPVSLEEDKMPEKQALDRCQRRRRFHFHITLTASEAAFASELGDGNRSRGISLALATARMWLAERKENREYLEIKCAAERSYGAGADK